MKKYKILTILLQLLSSMGIMFALNRLNTIVVKYPVAGILSMQIISVCMYILFAIYIFFALLIAWYSMRFFDLSQQKEASNYIIIPCVALLPAFLLSQASLNLIVLNVASIVAVLIHNGITAISQYKKARTA